MTEPVSASSTPELREWQYSIDRQQDIASLMAMVLIGLLFGLLMIGPQPFTTTDADKAAIASAGSAYNRIVILVVLAMAVPIAAVHLENAVLLLRRNWLVGAIVAWSCLSFVWASHPDLVIRRGFAFVLIYLTLVAVASGSRSSLDLVRPLSLVFVVITLLNLVSMWVFPASSQSPIGENGIFDNKNTAGTMAMLALLFLGTSWFAAKSWFGRIALLLILAGAAFFLVATESKTSIGVTVLAALTGGFVYCVIGSDNPVRILAVLSTMTAIIAAAVVYLGLGFDDADLRLFLFGDLTFTGRTEIWQHIAMEIARRPWLGHGFGSFWDTGNLVNPILSAPASAWFMDAQLINTAHNGYLDAWLQTGFIGFLLGALAILRCLALLLIGASRSEGEERIALTGALCVALALVLNNFLESYLFRSGDALGYLFILIMLQAEAARSRQQRTRAGAR